MEPETNITTVQFRIVPHIVLISLIAIALVLCLLSVGLRAHEWHLGVNNTHWAYRLSNMFSVNREGNIPSWFNASLLLTACLLSTTIARYQLAQQLPWRRYWVGLAILFLYLTLDEAGEIHEIFTIPLQEALDTKGHLNFAWVLVGIPFALMMGVIFLPFVLALPRHITILFLLAGGIYVGGAVGIESISANIWYENDGPTLTFSTVGAVEEFFEMTGVSLMIYGLLIYLSEHVNTIQLMIQSPQEEIIE